MKHSIDAIEQYAIGQTPFPNETNAITNIAAKSGNVMISGDIADKIQETVSLVSDKKNPVTLADLISGLPAHQQIDVLARVLEIAGKERSGEQSPLQKDQSNELG